MDWEDMAAPAPIAERAALAAIHPEQEYFFDGISEDIITALSKSGEWGIGGKPFRAMIPFHSSRFGFDFNRRGEKTMTALVIGEIEVSEENRKDFENVFLTQAHKELDDAGAKIIAGGWDNAVSLVGIPPKNRYVVIQFQNMEALDKWWQGPSGAFVREKLKQYGNVGWRLIAARKAIE
jgi:uncharacterized protein (DUF1330 family)